MLGIGPQLSRKVAVCSYLPSHLLIVQEIGHWLAGVFKRENLHLLFVAFWTVVGFESQFLLELKKRRKKRNKEWITSNKLMKDLSRMF